MKQGTDEGLPWLGQQTPSAPGDTLSGMNFAPMAFTMNQSSAVCLPLVCDSQSLMWVHSDEINLQPNGVSELDKAFNRFPYLTQKQTAALAERCSLHPDQVKVWFMVQRLHYGISWDYKDIPAVRRKFKSSQEKEEQQNRKGEEIKGPGVMKTSEEQSASERRMMGENEPNEQRKGKIKQEKPVKIKQDRGVEEGKKNTEKKQKKMAVRKKRKAVVEKADEVRSIKAESNCHKATQSEIKLFSRKKITIKAEERPLLDKEWPEASPLSQRQAGDVPPLSDSLTQQLRGADASHIYVTPLKSSPEGESATDAGKLKELWEMSDNLVVADGSPTITQQQHLAHACTFPSVTKTQAQIEIRNRQCQKTVENTATNIRKNNRKRTWKMTLDSQSCGEVKHFP